RRRRAGRPASRRWRSWCSTAGGSCCSTTPGRRSARRCWPPRRRERASRCQRQCPRAARLAQGAGTPRHGRNPIREVLVGVLIVAALGGLIGLFVVASSGPGFLSSRRTIEVVFRDGQGIRVGSPVRIAGIDAGRVEEVDLTETDGFLVAKLKLSLPT